MSDGRRRWLELSVRSPSVGDKEPLLVEGLLALGGRATEERDGWLVTHLEEPPDLQAFLRAAASTLREASGLDAVEVRTAWRAHEEWAEIWKRGLGARRITERLLVRPSWISGPVAASEIELVMDPGVAFGTAEHGTTRGCLRLLDGAVRPGDRILDVGSGSGILAIAAALLGASEVLAFEGDALACEALRLNLERNAVAEWVRCIEGMVGPEGIAQHGPANGVVANIVTGVLTDLLPGLVGALADGGWLILSGIRDTEWPEMLRAARRAGLGLVELDSEGEWRSARFEIR